MWWRDASRGDLGNTENPFIAIVPGSTLVALDWVLSTDQIEIWLLNWVQTNDLYLIELVEIEVLDYLTVCNQMADAKLNC